MIEVKHVEKAFGKKHVLKDMTFTAEKGDITCLVGVNGSGKTTILNAIMNLTPIKKGEILIDGQPLIEQMYERIAYIPDSITMLESMKIRDAFAFMEDHYVVWNEKRAQELLSFFKLTEEEKIQNLSKGNKAKVNMLLGLALDVDYILMDEPFSGIDIFSREQIADVFTSHLIAERGVLITTHEISDIEHLIDQVILIDDGKVIKQFHAETLREEEGKSIVDVMREVYRP